MDMQQTQQPASAGFFSPNDQQSDNPQSGVSSHPAAGNTGFTINSDQIEKSFKDQLDDRQDDDLTRVVDEGNELLFGEETHYQLMDQLKDSKNISADLGNGAFSIMSILIKQGGNTMPGDIVLPAGMILMSRAAEFINESGLTPITDDDFEESSHIFSTKIMNTYDPEFRKKVEQYGGQAQQPDALAQGSAQQSAMVAPQGGGGLLREQQTGA